MFAWKASVVSITLRQLAVDMNKYTSINSNKKKLTLNTKYKLKNIIFKTLRIKKLPKIISIDSILIKMHPQTI